MKHILRAAPLVAAMAATPAMAQAPLEIVQAVPCAKARYIDLWNEMGGPAPLGMEQSRWTKEMAEALLNKADGCAQIGEAQTKTDRNRLEYRLSGFVAKAQTERQIQGLLQRTKEKEQRQEAERQAAETERKRQQEERRLAEAEKKSAEMARIRERLAGLPTDVRKFIAENPGMDQPSFGTDGGPQALISLYTSELAFRVCRERFGGWDAAVTEAKRRSSLIQTILVDGFGMPADKVARLRAGLGLDTGQSEIIERMRADRDMLRSCREFQSAMGSPASSPLR